jgi:hypothetical protein
MIKVSCELMRAMPKTYLYADGGFRDSADTGECEPGEEFCPLVLLHADDFLRNMERAIEEGIIDA